MKYLSAAISRFVSLRRRAVLFLLALLVSGVMVGIALLPTPPSVVILPLTEKSSALKAWLRQFWRPPVSIWAARLRGYVLGPRAPVALRAIVWGKNGISATELASLGLDTETHVETNGLGIWLVDEAQAKALRGYYSREASTPPLFQPSVQTADGVESSIFSGSSVPIGGIPLSVGFSANFLPRVHRGLIDLTMSMSQTEAITNIPTVGAGHARASPLSMHTNFAVRARIQIPKGKGVFVLSRQRQSDDGNTLGVLLSAFSQP